MRHKMLHQINTIGQLFTCSSVLDQVSASQSVEPARSRECMRFSAQSGNMGKYILPIPTSWWWILDFYSLPKRGHARKSLRSTGFREMRHTEIYLVQCLFPNVGSMLKILLELQVVHISKFFKSC